MSIKVMDIFLQEHFHLKEIILKEQHNCRSTAYWARRSQEHNFLLIAHEYIFILKK